MTQKEINALKDANDLVEDCMDHKSVEELIRREWQTGYLKFLEEHFLVFERIFGFNPYRYAGQESVALLKDFLHDPEGTHLIKTEIIQGGEKVEDDIEEIFDDLSHLSYQMSAIEPKLLLQIKDLEEASVGNNEETIVAIETRFVLMLIVEYLATRAIVELFDHLRISNGDKRYQLRILKDSADNLTTELYTLDNIYEERRMKKTEKEIIARESNPATQTDYD